MNTMASKFLSFIFFGSLLFVVLCQYSSFNKIQLPPNVTSPVAVTFDFVGRGPFVAISDGRILQWLGPLFGFTDFAYAAPNRNQQLCDGTTDPNLGPICGKPFALSFSLKGYLYIADPYFGLLVVGPNGGLATQLATSAEGVPFRFLNAVDVDLLTGTVYFTDSSETFELRNVTQPGIISDSTGRLMRYEPLTRQITLLLRGLAMPSGVSVSIDGSFVLVSQDTGNRIQKYWLRGFNGGTLGILLNLPGNPTKIRRNLFGDFWVPVRVLGNQQPTPTVMPHGLKINQFGTVLANVSSAAQYNNTVSVVLEHNGALFAGSRFVDFVGVYTY